MSDEFDREFLEQLAEDGQRISVDPAQVLRWMDAEAKVARLRTAASGVLRARSFGSMTDLADAFDVLAEEVRRDGE